MTKFIYISKIHLNQSISCLSVKVRIKELKNSKALLIIQKQLMMFKTEVLIVFDDLIADMKANKKLSSIIIEVFLRGRELKIALVLNHNLIKTVSLKL